MGIGLFLLLRFVQPVAAQQPATPDRPGTASPGESDIPTFDPTTQPSSPPTPGPLDWLGLRPKFDAAGVSTAGTVTADYSRNFRGGLDTAGGAFRHLLDVRVSVDTSKSLKLPGGTFSIDFQNQNGPDASSTLTGDVQGFDNLDADGRTQIAELWYQQYLGRHVRLKVGKVDANSEFALPNYGTNFLGSGDGHSPTIGPLPTYPDPAVGVNLFVFPVDHVFAGVGWYDGSVARGVQTGSYGPRYFFRPNGHFTIGQVGLTWLTGNRAGRVAVGGWYSTADFKRFDGTARSGTGGTFAVLDQTLWQAADDSRYVTVFASYGHADKAVNAVPDFAAVGFAAAGFRPDDLAGVAVDYARLSHSPGTAFARDFECSIETFYGVQITRNLLVKPDLQYIVHPAYAPGRDALVMTVRVQVSF